MKNWERKWFRVFRLLLEKRKKFSINGARDLQKMKFLKKVVHVLTTKKGSILTKRRKKDLLHFYQLIEQEITWRKISKIFLIFNKFYLFSHFLSLPFNNEYESLLKYTGVNVVKNKFYCGTTLPCYTPSAPPSNKFLILPPQVSDKTSCHIAVKFHDSHNERKKKTQALFYYWTTEMICFFKFCSNFQRSYRVCMRRNHQYYYYKNLRMSHFLRPYPPQNRKKCPSIQMNEKTNITL